ncbi:MAG: outer membrane beta-barrel protein [Woeseia sp.]|nr:outer membrane beta-barrel protein [Woeseia sp.]
MLLHAPQFRIRKPFTKAGNSSGSGLLVLLHLCIASVLPAHAQNQLDLGDWSLDEQASLFEPSLGIELRHDDNIFRSAINEQSSLITILSPEMLIGFAPSNNKFALAYSGEFASYADSSTDNYADHNFGAAASFTVGRRGMLEFIGTYEDAHQNRGSGLSEGFVAGANLLLDEPDEYTSSDVLGRFTFGTSRSTARLVMELGQGHLEYTNDLDRNRFFEYDDRYAGATFYLRVMSNTSLLLDVRGTDIEYPVARALQPRRDSKEYRYLLGATWDVTGKSAGTVKVGFVEKRYPDPTRADFAEASWEVEIRWSPRSYSYFDFATSRYPSEVTSVTGDLIDNTDYSIAWSHEWNERIKTELAASYEDEDFQGSALARTQKLFEYGVTLTYEMRRWLSWDLGVDVSSRDSNIDNFDFDGTIIRLAAQLTF